MHSETNPHVGKIGGVCLEIYLYIWKLILMQVRLGAYIKNYLRVFGNASSCREDWGVYTNGEV